MTLLSGRVGPHGLVSPACAQHPQAEQTVSVTIVATMRKGNPHNFTDICYLNPIYPKYCHFNRQLFFFNY